MIDVGANVGIFSVLAAKAVGPAGRVFAFEPHPLAFARLASTFNRTALMGDVTCINAAASSAPGSISFSPAALSVQNTVADMDRAAIAVDSVRLDDAFGPDGPPRVDLLKVDVEGHEIEVLKGAVETLKVVDVMLDTTQMPSGRHLSFCLNGPASGRSLNARTGRDRG